MKEGVAVEGLHVELQGRAVLSSLNLELAAGSYGAVLGPSGAGKSTLLRALAGLIPSSGVIRIGGTTVQDGTAVVPPDRRGVGYVFQSLALWPHLSVRAHLEFVLGSGARSAARRIDDLLNGLGLSKLERRRPAELSGGERQRLALARALVSDPPLLLLDEPTSSVDPGLKAEMQELLSAQVKREGATVLHVTHDQKEAFALADRVFVLIEGRIEQVGTPEDVYSEPATRRVANLIGTGTLLPVSGIAGGVADSPLGRLRIAGTPRSSAGFAYLRPENLELVEVGGIPAVVSSCAFRGPHYAVVVRVGELRLETSSLRRVEVGTEVRLAVRGASALVEGRSSQ